MKVIIDDNYLPFLETYKDLGFSSIEDLIEKALFNFQEDIENKKSLELSADLYAKVFKEDKETKDITESGLNDWPN